MGLVRIVPSFMFINSVALYETLKCSGAKGSGTISIKKIGNARNTGTTHFPDSSS